MTEVVKCAIYARVSTAGQRDQHTIKSQLEILTHFAGGQGWQSVGTYVDDGRSGETIEGRPEFQRVLQHAEEQRFDILLVIDLDRITRSSRSAESGFIYDTLRTNGVKVATPTQVIDLKNDEQGLFAGIAREFARYEKLKILMRTRRGKLSKLREGKLADGSVPFGYRRVPDPSSPRGARTQVAIDEQEAALYRRIVKLICVEGLSLNKVCARLNAEALRTRTGRRWSSHVLSLILRNPAHKGQLFSHRFAHRFEILPSKRRPEVKVRRRFVTERPESEWITLPVEPIISPEVWDEVQARIAAARKNNLHYLSNGYRQGIADDPFLLRGLAYCGVCGSKLQMRSGTALGSRYYFCLWRQSHAQLRAGGTRTCTFPWIQAALVEDWPLTLLSHALMMPGEILERFADLLFGRDHLDQLRRHLGDIGREEKRVREQEHLLLEKALAQGFSQETVQTKVAELRSRLEWLAENRMKLDTELKDAESKADLIIRLREESRILSLSRRALSRWWNSATKCQQQRLLRTLIDPDRGGGVFVYPPPPGYIPDPELDLNGWGGRVECRFKYNPSRLIEALESMGVVKGATGGKGGGDHGGSAKGPSENLGEHGPPPDMEEGIRTLSAASVSIRRPTPSIEKLRV